MKIEIEDSRVGGPVTEGFTDLLHRAVSRSLERRGPSFSVQRVSRILAERDLDQLDSKDLKIIFADAGWHFQRLI